MDRDGLADFLRRRREALRPEDVGLREGRRRRTAGLRREEVALLAHMSTDFYARLEQRRGSRPSEQTVGALARALRLTQDEREHLFQLAGHVAPPRGIRSDHVTPALLRVLDRLDTPARSSPTSAWSSCRTHSPRRCSASRRGSPASSAASSTAGSPTPPSASAGRGRITPIHSRSYAASLRLAQGRDPEGARELVAALLRRSAEFAALWERHEVAERSDTRKRIAHPEVGLLTLDCQILTAENQLERLVVFTAAPGSEDAERLAMLAVIGTQTFDTSVGSAS